VIVSVNPFIIVSYLIAIGIDVAFPLLLAVWVRRKYGVQWTFFLYGALVFLVFQILTRVPAIQVAQYLLRDALQASETLLLGWLAIAAITAGLFEEVGRYLGYRYLWRKEGKMWERALMYGVGHGGLESMLLVGGLAVIGLVNVIVLSTMDANQLPLAEGQLAQLQAAQAQIRMMPWWLPLLGGVERVFAMSVQVSLSVMVLQCFLRDSLKWLWAAIGYHALLDLVAVILNHFIGTGKGMGPGVAGVEAVVAIFAAISLSLTLRLRDDRYSASATPPQSPL
jgi:uncharacterized membrane protein YhfC